MIFQIYKCLTIVLAPFIYGLLRMRVRSRKASSDRVPEYMGFSPDMERPKGTLFWVHAASVGEAQSALRLIDDILDRYSNAYVMVTTGTLTSAHLMGNKLPDRAFHRFYPLDQAGWVARFLDYWQPDFAIWLESELWPNMLCELSKRQISAVLVNARMSQKSAARWSKIPAARTLFAPFNYIFAQTESDANAFISLGVEVGRVTISGNVKYSAKALSYNDGHYDDLKTAIGHRRVWLYASSHKGEEILAAQVHAALQKRFGADVLTIIVPRHPERREDIVEILSDYKVMLRGDDCRLPEGDTDIYIADTLGELGLFYALCPIAVIGRSFSDDGGGGHNPIEAAQLNCAVLSGANMKYQQEIFNQMRQNQAADIIDDKDSLADRLIHYFDNAQDMRQLRENAKAFVDNKDRVLAEVEAKLWPLMDDALLDHGEL